MITPFYAPTIRERLFAKLAHFGLIKAEYPTLSDSGLVYSEDKYGRPLYYIHENKRLIPLSAEMSEEVHGFVAYTRREACLAGAARYNPIFYSKYHPNIDRHTNHSHIDYTDCETLNEPPRIAEFIVALFAEQTHKDSILQSLGEDFDRDLKADMSVGRARMRYWAASLRSLGPLALAGLKRLGIWGLILSWAKKMLG